MKQKHKYSPAEFVIMKFGGIRPTARATGYQPNAILKWRYRKGFVPTSAQPVILKAAQDMGIDITAEDLIFGREIVFDE